ncbi:MAG: Ig-like domain-containing protein, partial [Verrucomicrobiales bacterium]|nr:Ig-like domain-containing protein [Verrucomicrobiales bacterium]
TDALPVGDTVNDIFTYTVSDGNGGTDTAELNITVTGVNDAPPSNPADSSVGVFDDVDEIDEDAAPITGDVLANDSDPDTGDTLTVSEVNGVAGNVANAVTGTFGDLTLAADGTYSYDLDSTDSIIQALGVGETQIDSFTYTADDGNGGSAAATLTITINGVNDAPPENPPGTPGVDFGVFDDADSISEDAFPNSTNGNVLDNDLDPDGDTLTVSEVDGASGDVGSQVSGTYGVITIDSDGEYIYQLDNSNATVQALGDGENVLETFEYTANDGNGGTATATLTITINGVNDATVTAPDRGITDEDTAITIDVLANDDDADQNDSLTITSVTQPSDSNDGVVTNNGGDLTFTPGSNFDSLGANESATTTFTYTTIAAGSNETATETVTVTVNGLNDAPTAVNDAETTDQDTVVNIDLLGADDSVAADSDPDNDALIVTQINGITAGGVITLASGALLQVNGNGTVDYDPNGQFDSLDQGDSATDSFTYVISDGNGGTSTATATVTINGVEDATDTEPDIGVTDEETPITLSVLDNDTDPDAGETLTIASVSTPSKGSASTDGTTVTFDPNSEFEDLGVGESEVITFEYTLTTGEVETVTVTVNGVNDGPVAVNDIESTNQDSVVNIDLLGVDDSVAADSDPDGDALTVTEINGVTSGGTITLASGALVTVNGNGTVDYNPNDQFDSLAAGSSVTDSFTYVISDGNGATSTATATVTINGVDDAMETDPDFGSTFEGSPVTIDVLNNDSDVDAGDTLSINSVNQPADANDGTVVNNGTDLTFTPGSNFESLGVGESATTTFTYVAEAAGSGETRTETVTVTINGLNDDPTAADDIGNTDEDTSIAIDVLTNDTDLDTNDTLTVTAVSQPPGGQGSTSVTSSGGDVTFNPGNDFQDLAQGETEIVVFDYDVSDGSGGNDNATVRVTVTGVNDNPDLVDDFETTDEETAVIIDVLANDSDVDNGDTLTLTDVTSPGPGNGTASITNGGTRITFDPGSDFQDLAVGESEEVTFQYEVTDSYGATSTADVTVTVEGLNDGPDADDDEDDTTENASIVIDVLDNDDDPDTSDTLTITNVSPTSSGRGTPSISGGGTTVTFDPGTDFDYLSGSDSEIVSFTYDISDGNGGTDTATVLVTVNGVNDNPEANDDDGETDEDSAVVISVLNNDTDSDTSDTLTVISVDTPALGNTAITGGGTTVTFNPGTDYNYLGEGEEEIVSVDYTIADDSGATDTATILITVNGTNDRPGAVNDQTSTDENNSVVIDVTNNDQDPDSTDTLTVTSVTTPSPNQGTVSITNGGADVTFDPGSDFDDLAVGDFRVVTFNYVVADDEGASDSAMVEVTVNGTNDGPVADPDFATTTQNSNRVIQVLTNDDDPDTGDNLTVISINQPDPGKGTASIRNSGTRVRFEPGDDFDSLADGESEEVTFSYVISDGNGGTDTADITVTVTGTNDGPTATDDFDTTDEDTSKVIDVLGNDDDPDTSDTLTVTGVTGPPAGKGSVSITNGGADVTFDPGSDFDSLAQGAFEEVTFSYTMEDGDGETDTANVTITVTGVNDAPVANDDNVVSTTDIDPVTIDVISNDTDIDGTVDPTTIDLDQSQSGQQTTLSITGEGLWEVLPGGNVRFTPESGIDSQPSSITYSVEDNNGAISLATINLKYSAADVWFGNDESGSVNNSDFDQSQALISGAANQMTFATGDLAFNAALFSWSGNNEQENKIALSSDEAQFATAAANYDREYRGWTEIGEAIRFGTTQIVNSVAAKRLAGDPRAEVPQVMVILTDADPDTQIIGDSDLLPAATAAKDAGIILVFVAIQEAAEPDGVARLQQAASEDGNNQPLVVVADSYADIDAGEIADLLNAIREAAAAGLLPVVIDMDGDGVEFNDIENGIEFDADDDGQDEKVAWADEDDAVLVYDENGNDTIDGLSEIAFARYSDEIGATDLEGLRHFDSNEDLILDANDDEFDSFKLWQDRDGDGEVGDGEMMTLTEAGIESLELVSDENSYYTAGGDVHVHGEAGVNYADGSKGTLADATFGYEELRDGDDSLEIITDSGETLDVNDS